MADTNKKQYKPIIIGASFVLAIAIFIWGFNFLKGTGLFNDQTIYYASYQKVNGLINGNPVVVNGLRIGQVKKVYFNQNMSGSIMVSMMLSTNLPIPNNSVAHIFSSDLMGSKAIELKLGDSKTPLLKGDTLPSSVEGGLMDEVNSQLKPIINKAEDLMVSIDTLVTSVQSIFNASARENLSNSFANIERTLANLKSATSNIDNLVVEESSRISTILINLDSLAFTLNHNKSDFTSIIQNFKTISDSLAYAEIPATFTRINSALADVETILEKVNHGHGTLGMLMNDDSLYLELNRSATALDSLINDVKNNPKKYVKFSLF